jgi:hypothetical protein
MLVCWPDGAACVGWAGLAAAVGWAAGAAVGWLVAGALEVQPASKADNSTKATNWRARETVKAPLPRVRIYLSTVQHTSRTKAQRNRLF